MEKILLWVCTIFAIISVLFFGAVGFAIASNIENIQAFLEVVRESQSLDDTKNENFYEEHTLETSQITPFPQSQGQPPRSGVKLDPNNPAEWFREIKDGATSSYIPDDPVMSTPEELFTAMNNYRASHGLSILQSNGKLCEVAGKRAAEAAVNFSHGGFEKYVQDQNEFSLMAEVLHTGGKLNGVHLVEYGWDRSLTGHKETIRDPRWTHGCGGISGTTAAFIFGQHF